MTVTETPSTEKPHTRLVGERLRAARLGAGMTQAEVARRAGVSLSFVRLVESGKSDISLSRLLKWTTIFGLPVAELFTEAQGDDLVVVRPDERVEVPSREAGVRFLLLSPGGNHDMEPAIFELASGAEMQRTLTHQGEETAYVLTGRIQIWVGDRVALLERGDSVYYRSQLPHRFANPGSEPASILVTTTHPQLHRRLWPTDGDASP
jgi:transcriptional regulator with XRE-family HTH domain